ncbi:MAG: SsrA-binding protein [Candidatus Ryanbacteria bacterium RIFCSPHIGHO2_12_FULL_47_12b]|uniref:SsrA-binding protein n=1 Tax=Candidatus Ryanbacteria bacterium RIFCSPLOWO2_12_FULL_47_9c TaxID=1802131 RepID=A0A1G2H696_9BACT|nr:MAG: SsrA-binding protein [Parcubacteria group bacterium GW2011_GWA2_47_10b]KKU85860.1 MAG: SsrA-binding protein [Parcubacteria group bacterium GW2011_GWA1_47_9]OGZ52426.1 MAG: SsrA-binding protein [Candidatus Ryanbacteria bacterium RIFCSPLOWO2_01_FULL_47_79]OGZ52698.1 MAG: SsrA-binding protein [Candidatus Ryanbacteria bacterium RIFCSPHIGHO2_12_FULL_47_12b]OGZ57987.1 MAG: SsrA-binding protein [Candidatus Ryanbacteria bacterium RIFCSPLOWO2_12_FULL_47_9c]
MALAKNKKAYFNYEILETYEAGIELFGFEVKSVRAGNVRLEGARVIIRGGEAFLVGATIPPYQPSNTPKDYEPDRTRRLLLHKKELSYLAGKEHERGLTLVPIRVYNKVRKIKLQFGVARGKKKFDKREVIKQRESKRKISRELKKF